MGELGSNDTMGCGDSRPVIRGECYSDEGVSDSTGLALFEVRGIRDDIERRVLGLVASLATNESCFDRE